MVFRGLLRDRAVQSARAGVDSRQATAFLKRSHRQSRRFPIRPFGRGKTTTIAPGRRLRFKASRQGIYTGKQVFKRGVLVAPASSSAFLSVNGRPYRGVLILRPRSKHAFDVIEQVGLEEYLGGVLPREVDPEWPADALKAQAVVSRTFVLANLDQAHLRGYDVSSDVFSQVYGGVASENPATTQAVEDTQREILVDSQGKPAQTFFHSSCGGRTENPRYVWKSLEYPPGYLAGVKDEFCKEDPFYSWRVALGVNAIRKRLRRIGYALGDIKKITVAAYSPSGRASMIGVVTSHGKILISSNRFRLAMGPDVLRSTLLTGIERAKKSFIFEGRGWGHGVGFCQWGARGRALAGQSYKDILAAYYPGTKLAQANP